MIQTVEEYRDGVLVNTYEIEVPDPPASVEDLRDKLAAANTTVKLREVLGEVLDLLDPTTGSTP